MRPAERVIESPRTPPVGTVRARLAGWGGGPAVLTDVLRAAGLDDLRAAVVNRRPAPAPGAIARGMGRSYGDAAQLRDGLVLDTTSLRSFEFDRSAGILIAEAGATLGQLLAAAAPAGWVLPVVPGTQHVTVGGAIAADIHGKNHPVAGTFGRYVQSLGLLTADGEIAEVSADRDAALFDATLGGMGLTGVILWARIELAPLSGAGLAVDTDRVRGLDQVFAALLAPGGPHRVAWLDLLGPEPVPAVVSRAGPLTESEPLGSRARFQPVASRLTIPEWWPAGVLRPGTVRAYNAYRFRRAPRQERGRPEPFGAHMFALDGLANWPRLYGWRGFVQYQLALPRGREAELEELIRRLRSSAVPCYLAVLKELGPPNGAPLSFPIAGWTLALDLPRGSPELEPLLASFDELVAQAGGRVYLAKDARLRPDALAAMYPRLDEWRAVRDRADPEGLWCSDLALRTGLAGGQR
ncbi:MAG TPA: FAD-binding oxidoreductase [Solirubrobacteraceae bacterium]|jgi:decaprenylphospho-beta-D-ribofuranose 2-oxidase